MNAKADIRLGWYWGYQNVWGSYVAQPYSGDNTPIVEARRSPSCSTVIGAFEAATLEEAEAHIKAMVTKVGVDHGKYPPKAQPTESPVKPSKIIPYPMSKDHLEVITANHADQIDRINQYHGAFQKSYQDQMGYAFLCGVELSQIKTRIPHGQFLEFCTRYLPAIPERSAQRYMAFADALRTKSATVADLANKPLQLTNGTLPEKQREEVLKAVHDVADGKTLTQFYRDLGLIRQPEKAGGFRPDAKAVEKWLKEHHPELAGTKFADLPEPIQKDFKKQYQPKIDPKLLAESKRQKAEHIRDDLNQMLTDQEFKKYWSPELRAEFKDLFWDFHRALTALDKKAPKGKSK